MNQPGVGPGESRPEQVSPAVTYLSHESCALNGEALTANGRVARVVTFESTGYTDSGLAIEDVAHQVDGILDLDGMTRYPQRNFRS